MIFIILAIIISYLIGAVPTGYIFAKVLRKIDIREHGSGNIGATNVLRVVGKLPGIIVFIIDVLKGLVAVTIIPIALTVLLDGRLAMPIYIKILFGAAAIVGHMWTCFLGFKGGKGVATTAGVIVGLAPGILLAAFLVWLAVFYAWKYVSLASICASISLPIFAVIFKEHIFFICFCAILCIIGTYAHRPNIKRLIQGTESKFIKASKS